jgi:hypothetical protein
MALPASHDSLHIAASSFDAQQSMIADELVEIALSTANTQLDALISQLTDTLQAHSRRCTDADEAQRCSSAIMLLKQNRYPFFYLASSHIRSALEQAMQAVLHPDLAFRDTLAPLVPLAPDLEVDKKLSLIKISRAIENDCMESFSTLAARLTHLFGCRALTITDHPFRPSLYLNALHDAWCEFQPESRVHHLVFRSLGTNLCINVVPILDALNAALAKRGVLPTLPLSMMARSTDIMADAQAREAPGAAVADPMLAQLQRLLQRPANVPQPAGRQARAEAFPALFQEDLLTTHSAHHALLAHIAELQRKDGDLRQPARHKTVLNDLLHSAPDGGWSQTDRITIELLAKVFDAIFGNVHIPPEMKVLLGVLQLPVLKAALQDTEFFLSDSHPARRAIELLAQLSIDCDARKGAGDPRHQLVLRNVKRIQSDQRSLAFAAALTDLETFLAAEDSRAQQALATPIAQALRKEKMLQAARAAKRDVALRIGTGEIAAFVETFLEDKWIAVLTLAYTLKDDKPQALDSATKTMDDLCWSVKPKITPDERKELVARLPAIVAMLNKWLDAIKWTDEARARFFDELARCHASIVRAPVELSPERRMQLALKAAKKAAERRLQRQASQVPEPAPDAFDEQVGALSSGAWVTFAQKDGPGLKVRLAWVSPMRSLYLFATPERREAFSLSDQEFARALRGQRARVVQAAGLVGRALADALLSKAANGDTLAKASAA